MKRDSKPRLAVTLGDAAGIGPEVIVAAWTRPEVHARVLPLVVGHPGVIRQAVRLLRHDMEVVEFESPSVRRGQWAADSRTIACLPVGEDDLLSVAPGTVDARTGEAAYQAVCTAAKLALDGHVDGVVTGPLSKRALHAAGHRYPGHTELLAELCRATDVAMMLYLPPGDAVRGPAGLGVVHVTLHQSLRSMLDELNSDAIVAKCRLADRGMRPLGARQPRIAVAALNPHAGEEGLFGEEERTLIAPAVECARGMGLDVTGPIPTDTLMGRARDGEFDAVVAMYHDQGHIALKLLDMHGAVNVTLGLPIVRTSVAHGTAFDRAWQGTARADGMVAALLTAGRLADAKVQT